MGEPRAARLRVADRGRPGEAVGSVGVGLRALGRGHRDGPAEPGGQRGGTGDYFLPGQVEGDPPPTLRGEQTELHPLQAVVVARAHPWAAPAGESQTDAFISSDGTHAFAEERCAHDLTPPAGLPTYGPDFTACANDGSHEQQPVRGRTYEFEVPAPPRPTAGAQLRYREVMCVAGSKAL